MAFDALETEFANAKLVRSWSRRDDRRYYWRLLPSESEACTRIATSFMSAGASISARRFSLSRSSPKFLELLGEPCAVLQFENFLCLHQRYDAVKWLNFLRYVHPNVVNMPQTNLKHPLEIYEQFVRKKSNTDLLVPISSQSCHASRSSRLISKSNASPSVRGSRNATVNVLASARRFVVSDAADNEANIAIRHGFESKAFVDISKLVLHWLEVEFLSSFLESSDFMRFSQLKEFAMRPVNVDDFSTFRVMGRGAYGAVSAVEKVNTHRIYAWKEMNKRQLKHQRAIDVALNEVKVLSEINSPFVTGLRYCLQTSESLILVLDFCSGGDLSYHMKRKPPINNYTVPNDTLALPQHTGRKRRKNPMPPDVAQFYAAEIILGLEHMHSKRIVFRDLKPANILLDRNGHILISDLGLAKKFTDKKPTTSSLGGTPGYWAPEVLARQSYALWVDWWSLGIFLYEALCGMRPACRCTRGTSEWCPFVDSKEQEDNAKKGGTLKLCVDFPEPFFSENAKNLIERLLKPRPTDRLGYRGSSEIRAHPFFDNINWNELQCRKTRPSFIPGDTVHAVSVQEVGEMNKQRYKKVTLDHRDHNLFAQFKFMDDRVVQDEIVQVLTEEAEKDGGQWTPFEMRGRPSNAHNPRCCVIL